MQKISILTLFILFSTVAYTQKNEQKLDKQLKKIQRQSNLPGFAIAIIKNDSVLFSKGYGYANTAQKIIYTPNHIQPLGSVSKTFIGLALLKAIELGYFTLETNINELLPFAVNNPNHPNDNIKLIHLATHTAGLVDDDTSYMNTYSVSEKPKMLLGDFLKAYYVPSGQFYKPTNFANTKPGTNYAYSNIASALAAYIIEVKSGLSFDAFTEKYIFSPLGMTSTHWFYNKNFAAQYATLYEVNKQTIPLYQQVLNADGSAKIYSCITYPDGSLKSSVVDLTKYAKAMLKGYNGEDGIISKASFATLFKKQFDSITMPTNMDTKELNRAIFWAYTKSGIIRHTGSDIGVFSFISINPKTTIARVFTLNTELEGEDNTKSVNSFLAIVKALDEFEKNYK
jgi:CubicO group peptidase (beta-lactamase class C family)